MFDDVCNVEDGAVVGWYVSPIGEEDVPTGLTAGFGSAEIAGIAVCGKFHVAGIVCDDCFFLGCKVVEQLERSLHCTFGWRC